MSEEPYMWHPEPEFKAKTFLVKMQSTHCPDIYDLYYRMQDKAESLRSKGGIDNLSNAKGIETVMDMIDRCSDKGNNSYMESPNGYFAYLNMYLVTADFGENMFDAEEIKNIISRCFEWGPAVSIQVDKIEVHKKWNE